MNLYELLVMACTLTEGVAKAYDAWIEGGGVVTDEMLAKADAARAGVNARLDALFSDEPPPSPSSPPADADDG